ncbi:MAG: 4Fe-4S dicluster-binding protein [Myxococcota bacterium]
MQLQAQQGLMTTYRQPWRNRGIGGWAASLGLIGFYCVLYWTEWLTPISRALGLGNKWYLYGLLYCVGMIGGAVYYLRHHGNSRYNQLRIATNVTVQVLLGFTLPFVLPMFGQPEFYFSYFWPLKYDYLFPHTLQSLPTYLAVYTVVGALGVAPLLAGLFGKRWYCSWVCGCGALANTMGDPWRHLTSSTSRSWRFEKVAIHTVLGGAVAMTAVVAVGQMLAFKAPGFAELAEGVKQAWGFGVGAVLAGVVGTGLYPLLGPRVWCRNFCPMAAWLGVTQRIGRFRIRVKPDMCISCGNCTTYCEMGIDVRSYAQSNQTFTRASCVGCGMCAHVCPRGVLKLESTWAKSPGVGRQGIDAIEW